MAYLAIAIWILIIIGAFEINVILGLIVLLGSIFALGGGFDNKSQKTKTVVTRPEAKPVVTSTTTHTTYYERILSYRRTATLDDVITVTKENNKASTSLLQRELNVSYKQAAQFIDEMEKQGIVGAQDGSRPRQVLIR
jgi:predicted transcriptional regulator